jgi:hypothetical protein
MVEVFEIAQKAKKKKGKKGVKAKPKAKAKPQPLPRSVRALLSYLGKSETAISGGRVPQRIQPTEQSITINLAGLERVSAPPPQDMLRSFIASTKERTGQNVQVNFQQQTYDQVAQLKKQLEEAEREQKRYEGRLKQGEDVLGALQATTQTKGITQRQLQQSQAQLRQELEQVKQEAISRSRQTQAMVDSASTQYKQVRENMGRFYQSQGYGFSGGGVVLGDMDVFDEVQPTGAGRAESVGERAASYSSLSRPDSYVAPLFTGGLEKSAGSSAKSSPAPLRKIKIVAKKGSGLEKAMTLEQQIKEKGRSVGMMVAGGGEAPVGVASPLETPTAAALRSRLAELAGTSKSKVKLGIKGRGAGAKYATITTDIEELRNSGLSGADLIQAIKQRHGANIAFS